MRSPEYVKKFLDLLIKEHNNKLQSLERTIPKHIRLLTEEVILAEERTTEEEKMHIIEGKRIKKRYDQKFNCKYAILIENNLLVKKLIMNLFH